MEELRRDKARNKQVSKGVSKGVSKMEENITKKIEHLETLIGKWFGCDWFCEVNDRIDDFNIKSPIEQYLYACLRYNIDGEKVELCEPKIDYVTHKDYLCGVEIEPQFKIDKYVIDFKITNYWRIVKNGELIQQSKTVLVECDGHIWHERTEEERKKEKARDRYLQRNNYLVFHYTGKEILDNGLKIANEILKEVGAI